MTDMSHQDLDEKPMRMSFKRSWEKIIESLELETLETNETIEKTYESDGLTMHSSIRRKNSENNRGSTDNTDKPVFEMALRETKGEAEILRDQVIDLESALLEETEKCKRYFKAIEALESDNERLENENMKLKEMYGTVNEKLGEMERQMEIVRQESILRMLGKRSKNTLFLPNEKFEDKLTAKLGIRRSGTESSKKKEKSLRRSRLDESESNKENRDANKVKRSYADDLWIKKFKYLKQKLISEQKRGRELEFLISTQKELLEAANKNIYQLKAEKRLAETKHDKISEELCNLNELRLKDKAKIDNVITFCDLIHNCSFPKEELTEKLEKFPAVVAAFLKGDTEAMASENKFSAKLIPSAKKHEILERFDSNQFGDPNEKTTVQELEDIRTTLNNIAETLIHATPTADPSVLTNLDKISHVHLTLEECLSTESHGIMNPHLDYKGKQKSESNVFKRAIRNSHSMLWNLQKGKGSVEDNYN